MTRVPAAFTDYEMSYEIANVERHRSCIRSALANRLSCHRYGTGAGITVKRRSRRHTSYDFMRGAVAARCVCVPLNGVVLIFDIILCRKRQLPDQ